MFNQIRFELQNKKVYLYLGATIACLVSVFGVILLMAASTEDLSAALPSPSPNTFGQILGEQSKLPSGQRPVKEEVAVVGPDMPVVAPSPVKSPSPSPSIIPSPSPTMSPSPSTSPSPSPTASPAQNTDTSGPSISEIQSTGIEANKVTIQWKTNEDADEKIEYGKNTSYGTNKDSGDKKTTHSVEITGLEANSTYHYRVTSKDNAGNSTTSGDNTFTTLP
jgi:hypothetical protein